MNIWNTLGIPATTDIVQIKRAYAEKARECHPEEHPQEYEILHQAYKSAVQFAKTKKLQVPLNSWDDPAERIIFEEESGRPEEAAPVETVQGEPGLSFEEVRIHSRQELYGRFFREFHYIVLNPYLMNNFFIWRTFLNDPGYRSFYQDQDFRQELIHTVLRSVKWEKRTLLFFDERLQALCGSGGSGPSFWNRVKYTYYFSRLLYAGGTDPSYDAIIRKNDETRKMNGEILQQIRNSGVAIPIKVENRKAAESYLQFYFPYAAEHEAELERNYKRKCKRRLFIRFLEISVVTGALLWVFMHL